MSFHLIQKPHFLSEFVTAIIIPTLQLDNPFAKIEEKEVDKAKKIIRRSENEIYLF